MDNQNTESKKARILVVDDELIVAANIKYTLQKYGYEVVGTAGSADEAILKAKEQVPDLVLIDVNLKDRIDGIEVAKIIQEYESIAIIFLTAYSDSETFERAKEAGPYGYLIKPFENKELYSAVEMALYKNSMEKILRESEKKYRSIFENIQDVYYEASMDGTILEVSPSISIFSKGQYHREELIGKSLDDLYVDKAERKALLSVLSEDGSVSDFEVTLKSRDNSFVRCILSAKIMVDFYGQPEKIIGSIHDITERQKMEDALRENEQNYRTLANSGRALIWLSGPDKLCNYFNNVWLEFTGRTLDQEMGNGWTEGVHPDDFQNCLAIYVESFNRRENFSMEYRLMHNSGEYRWILDDGSPRYNSEGKFLGYVGHCLDINDRKLAEQELTNYRNHLEDLVKVRTEELFISNEELQVQIEKQKEYELMLQQSLEKEKELNEMKSKFISTASHEFRTPLTSVLSSAELLQRYMHNWDDEKKKGHFERIKNSIAYLTNLLDDVLTINKAESGKDSYNPQMANLEEISVECVNEATNLSQKHSVGFSYNTKRTKYLFDPKQMKFILDNLLSNAIKYSPDGGKVKLSISADDGYLKMDVSDEGIGIPSKEINYIFDSFYRTRNVEAIAGTGLGLSIVKRAVDLHSGEITVKSELNKGTTFTVKIPIDRS